VPAQYKPGDQLPGTVYRVVHHLATGGMGTVYDVEDVSVGKRYVVKTLHPQLISRHDLARRMEAEARTLAKLQHPNIVDVVTAGVTGDEAKLPYYVMERLNGKNLRSIIERKGGLELSHCYRIAIDVLDALEHAHQNGVIHRDVKPENIFLHRTMNGATITKLLDFGIMRLLDKKSSHTHGKFIGTLRYASPEQIMGGVLGPATDIYSFGIVLYEMICGCGPFDDARDLHSIGRAHMQSPAPPPSLFAKLPPTVEQLVLSMLEKNPSERPPSCFVIANTLRRLRREDEARSRPAAVAGSPGSALEPLSSNRGPSADAILGPEPPESVHHVITPPSADMQSPIPSAIGDTVLDSNPVVSSPMVSALPVAPIAPPIANANAFVPPMAPLGPLTLKVQPKVQPNGRGSTAIFVPVQAPPPGPYPSGSPLVDRSAVTRPPVRGSDVQRLAPNGTMLDIAGPASAEIGWRSGPAQHRPPEALFPTQAASTSNGIITESSVTGSGAPALKFPTGTGPIAGEARTRPPSDRRIIWPVVVASMLGILIAGGAFLVKLDVIPLGDITGSANASTPNAPQTTASTHPTQETVPSAEPQPTIPIVPDVPATPPPATVEDTVSSAPPASASAPAESNTVAPDPPSSPPPVTPNSTGSSATEQAPTASASVAHAAPPVASTAPTASPTPPPRVLPTPAVRRAPIPPTVASARTTNRSSGGRSPSRGESQRPEDVGYE